MKMCRAQGLSYAKPLLHCPTMRCTAAGVTPRLMLAGAHAPRGPARTGSAAHEPAAVRLLPLQQRLDAGARHGQVAQQRCVHGRPAQQHDHLGPLAC